MSEEICKGVEILLKRCKTNPQEIIEEYGRWGQLRDAVFIYKERKDRSQWLRGLSEHEIDLLYQAFSALYKDVFNSWVMKELLDDEANHAQTQSQISGAYTAGLAQSMLQTKQRAVNSILAQGMAIAGGGGSGGTLYSGSAYHNTAVGSTTTATLSTVETVTKAKKLGLIGTLKKQFQKLV